MLSTNIKTTSDLMSIALRAEREAIRRYSDLADSMHKGNNESAAALFERMVVEEQEHERLLLEWMTQENISENIDIAPTAWKDPYVSTTYNDEAYDLYYSSPYRALAFAVHNEEIAFSFYTHVAASSKSAAIRKYAEILAREELAHASLLRAERRRAYHIEREANMDEPRLDSTAIENKTDLLAAAIYIDQYLATQMQAFAETIPQIQSLAKETQQQISRNEKALSNNIAINNILPNETIIKNIDRLKLYNSNLRPMLDKPDMELQRLWSCSDRSFSFYDAVVESTEDEAVMLAAQQLSSLALDRINCLKQVFEYPSV